MTIAFSIKSGQWTTEYSFEPTCYANTDGRMLASKDASGGLFWLHDEDADNRNKYYGDEYKSKLSVVSNEDPSATKCYEAISLETSHNSWNIDVETLSQKGTVDDLVERENDQYAPIPKNDSISTANLVYIGTVPRNVLKGGVSAGSLQLPSMPRSMAQGLLCFSSGGGIYGFNTNGIVTTAASFSGKTAFVDGFSESSRSISIQTDDLTGDVDPNNTLNSGTSLVDLFVAEPESGESMRGDYLLINIETKSVGPKNFELYAINVDQHKVNLDHSLGQNN